MIMELINCKTCWLGQLTIKLRARVCRTVMMCDVKEAIMLDCMRGESVFRLFNVRNLSEIPLHWSATMNDISTTSSLSNNRFEFTDDESGAPLVCNPISR